MCSLHAQALHDAPFDYQAGVGVLVGAPAPDGRDALFFVACLPIKQALAFLNQRPSAGRTVGMVFRGLLAWVALA